MKRQAYMVIPIEEKSPEDEFLQGYGITSPMQYLGFDGSPVQYNPENQDFLQQLDVKLPLYGSLSADGNNGGKDKHTPTRFLENGITENFI